MEKLILFIAVFTFAASKTIVAQEAIFVPHFDKAIISPHVQVTFTKGDNESVTIQNCTVSKDKIHIESNGKTLRVYLEGAREITSNETVKDSGDKNKKPLYRGTVLTVAISYKTLQELSVRGEETIRLNSKLDQDNFILTVYGESKIHVEQVQLNKLSTTVYGESSLEFKTGNITEQRFTVYGESKINTLGVTGKTAKATLYGEAELSLNVSDQLKVTAYGEAKVGYKGNPEIRKGLNIGNVKIYKLN